MSDAGHQIDHQQFKAQQPQPLHAAPRLVAVGLKSPQNIGMLFRIADAVGTTEIVLVNTAINTSSRKVRQVARHTVRHIKHLHLSLDTFLVQRHVYQPLVALEITSTSVDLFTTTLASNMTLVVGNELHGIPAVILDTCQQAIHIPMMGENSSMNVATAAGIALYEWHRQHRLD